jgi:glutathione S-transferase
MGALCSGEKPPSNITVYYWGPHPGTPFYGRGIGIYLTLNQAGFKYDMKTPADIPDGSSMAPPVVDIDGICMGQCPAILIALGDKFQLAGTTPEEKMRCLQALEDMNDVFGEHGKMAENEDRKKKWFTYLEKKMKGNKWLAGTSEPTIADFHGVFAFEWVKKKNIDFSEYPNMTKWWADIQAYPVVAEMYASCVGERKMIP